MTYHCVMITQKYIKNQWEKLKDEKGKLLSIKCLSLI